MPFSIRLRITRNSYPIPCMSTRPPSQSAVGNWKRGFGRRRRGLWPSDPSADLETGRATSTHSFQVETWTFDGVERVEGVVEMLGSPQGSEIRRASRDRVGERVPVDMVIMTMMKIPTPWKTQRHFRNLPCERRYGLTHRRMDDAGRLQCPGERGVGGIVSPFDVTQ